MRRLLHPCVVALALPSLLACSGASETTFIGEPGRQDSGDMGSSSSGGGGFDATTDAGDNGSDGTSDDSSNVGQGEDATADAASDGTGPDAAPPGVNCPQAGQTTHCMTGDTCCVATMTTLLGSTQTATCQSPSSMCTGAPLHCSSQADCKQGEICCGTETTTFGGTSYNDVSCTATCNSTIGATRVQFCDPGDTCPANTTCQTSTVLQNYTVCR